MYVPYLCLGLSALFILSACQHAGIQKDLSAPLPDDPSDRLALLHEAMDKALVILESKEYKRFYEECVDPFWMARGVADAGMTIDEGWEQFFQKTNEDIEFHSKLMLESIRKARESEPTWLLDGRVAHFIERGGDSHFAEFWVWQDGRWMISPET
ncbi:MAG: hypothetical protein AAGB26_03090 [Planctomycetota bacterium]